MNYFYRIYFSNVNWKKRFFLIFKIRYLTYKTFIQESNPTEILDILSILFFFFLILWLIRKTFVILIAIPFCYNIFSNHIKPFYYFIDEVILSRIRRFISNIHIIPTLHAAGQNVSRIPPKALEVTTARYFGNTASTLRLENRNILANVNNKIPAVQSMNPDALMYYLIEHYPELCQAADELAMQKNTKPSIVQEKLRAYGEDYFFSANIDRDLIRDYLKKTNLDWEYLTLKQQRSLIAKEQYEIHLQQKIYQDSTASGIGVEAEHQRILKEFADMKILNYKIQQYLFQHPFSFFHQGTQCNMG